jgi:hypothetical protein
MEASRPCKPDDGDNQMNEKDDDIAHPGMISKPEKTPNFAQFSNSPWTGREMATFHCFNGFWRWALRQPIVSRK